MYFNSKIYRIVIFLLCVHLLPIKANDDKVLGRIISLSQDTTVYEVLNVIGDSIGFYFSYNAALFNANRKVKIQARNETVIQILDDLFKQDTMNYKVIGNQIVINKPVPQIHDKKEVKSVPVNFAISGKVLDKQTGLPIPFATIGIPEKMNWTVCNFEGRFNLNIKNPGPSDTLQISCLGYKSIKLPYTQIEMLIDHTFLLSADYISIQEVIIRKIDPKTLIEEAIKKIKDNYTPWPFIFEGFYRETIQKNTKYVSVSEAFVSGKKAGYRNAAGHDIIKLEKGRKIVDDQRNDTVILKLQAGMYNSMQLDILKNRADFLNPEFFPDYNYKVSDLILSDNRYVYVIEFNRSGTSKYAMYKGKIYIDYDNAAILNIEFSLNSYGLKSASDFLILKKPHGIKIDAVGSMYDISYILGEDSLYYLNYIMSESAFKVKKRKQLFNCTYTIRSEVAITSVKDGLSKDFDKDQIATRKDVFTEQVTTYDPDFWKEYSYIPPDKSLLEAVLEYKD